MLKKTVGVAGGWVSTATRKAVPAALQLPATSFWMTRRWWVPGLRFG